MPNKDSKISGKEFMKFCYESQLEYKEIGLEHLNNDLFDVVIEGNESLIDPLKLKSIITKKIRDRILLS